MAYDEDELEQLEDEETLAELNVDENGHVIEGRHRRRNREDEYEPDFGEERERPEQEYEYEEPDTDDSYD